MLGKATSSGFAASVDTPLVSASATSRQNFQYFSIFFGINHAAAAIPLLYATTSLMGTIGYTSSGILYVSSVLGSLVVAAPVVQLIDAKPALIVAMILYSLFVLSVTIAVSLSDESLQQVLVYSGAIAGGMGASLLWTAQGTYFSRSARQLALCEEKMYTEITSEQGSTFAFWFLLFEVTFRFACWALQSAGISDTIVFGLCVLCAGISVAGVAGYLLPLGSEEQHNNEHASGSNSMTALTDILDLAKDCRIWCFAFTNFAFGLSAAYMNGYVNEQLSARPLGESSIGILTAVTSICAVGLAVLYGALAISLGKGSVIFVGACSMFVIPVLTLFFGPGTWGWGIALLYVLQGSARAVYEGINRAVFAEAFDSRTESAFALCSAQSSFAFAISFFASEFTRAGVGAAVLIMILAFMAYPLYCVAQTLPPSSKYDENFQNL